MTPAAMRPRTHVRLPLAPLLLAMLGVLLALLAGPALPAQGWEEHKISIKASFEPAAAPAGAKVTLKLAVTIEPGWHIYGRTGDPGIAPPPTLKLDKTVLKPVGEFHDIGPRLPVDFDLHGRAAIDTGNDPEFLVGGNNARHIAEASNRASLSRPPDRDVGNVFQSAELVPSSHDIGNIAFLQKTAGPIEVFLPQSLRHFRQSDAATADQRLIDFDA